MGSTGGLKRAADVTSEDGALRSPLSGMFPRDLPVPESLSDALLPVRDQVRAYECPASPAMRAHRVAGRCPTVTRFKRKL